MTKDPYEVLGIDRSASTDEVKRAYRTKARENHPDLNPNDPEAAKRMNEVNEAYDRIMNPEKYEAADRRARAARGRNEDSRSGAAGYGYGGSQYGTSGQGGRSGGTEQSEYGYGYGNPYGQGGSQGWTVFDFDDLFGFGGFGRDDGAPIHPEAIPRDCATVRSAINDINTGQYRRALTALNTMVSTQRDARWHYLVAIANHGAGNTLAAVEHIRKAVQMDPSNQEYLHAQRAFQYSGDSYQRQGEEHGFTVTTINPMALCLGVWCCGPTLCRFCAPGFGFYI